MKVPVLFFLLVLVVGGIACIVVGIVLLAKRGKQAGGGACGKCGYTTRGIGSFLCPECGADLREVGIKGGVSGAGPGGGRVAGGVVLIVLGSLMLLALCGGTLFMASDVSTVRGVAAPPPTMTMPAEDEVADPDLSPKLIEEAVDPPRLIKPSDKLDQPKLIEPSPELDD